MSLIPSEGIFVDFCEMTQPIRKFVINLRSAKKRREYISTHLGSLDIDFEFFDAIDGKTLSQEYIDSVCDVGEAARTWKSLKKGEVGCNLSHMAIYRKMIEENISEAIIFEDDAVVGKDFNQLIANRQAWMPRTADLVLLGSHFSSWLRLQKTHLVDSEKNYRIGKMYFIAGGTYGYYITREGATKMLKKNNPILRSIDDITGDAVFGGHNLYAVLPPLVDFLSEESMIRGTDIIGNKKRESFNGIYFHRYARLLIIDYGFSVSFIEWLHRLRKKKKTIKKGISLMLYSIFIFHKKGIS